MDSKPQISKCHCNALTPEAAWMKKLQHNDGLLHTYHITKFQLRRSVTSGYRDTLPKLTWKRLQIDGNILGGISQALYPGEGEKPKNWLSRVLSLVSTPRRKIMQSYAYAGVKYAQCLQM